MVKKIDDKDFMAKYNKPLSFGYQDINIDPEKKRKVKKSISPLETGRIAAGHNLSIKKLGLSDDKLGLNSGKKGDKDIQQQIDLLITRQLINNEQIIFDNCTVAYRVLKGLQFRLHHYDYSVKHLDDVIDGLSEKIGGKK